MRSVEQLLNMLWLLVAILLLAYAVRARSRGQLRCSLAVSLGCTVLLALVLFPALSMTDDMQRATLDVESSSRHLGSLLLLGSLDDAHHVPVTLWPALLLMILFAGRSVRPGMLARLFTVAPAPKLSGPRPEAVRPPPFLRAV